MATPATTAMQTRAVAPFESSKLSAVAGAEAAQAAVRQRLYQPTLLNGNPVPVQTEVRVNFTLLP